MLTEERKNRILAKVEESGSVTVTELCELLDTSESTIRRDLTELDRIGRLTKVHGGAVRVGGDHILHEDNISDKEKVFSAEKSAIGKYAASLITKGDSVFIDAGTTTIKMVSYITERDALYVTNGFTHAAMLAKAGFKVILIGGEVKSSTEAVIGSECVESIRKYNFTKCFLGTNGIHEKCGFTTPTVEEANVKKTVLEQSHERYVLADHSKFNKIAAISFANLEKACIITDAAGNDTYKKRTRITEVSE